MYFGIQKSSVPYSGLRLPQPQLYFKIFGANEIVGNGLLWNDWYYWAPKEDNIGKPGFVAYWGKAWFVQGDPPDLPGAKYPPIPGNNGSILVIPASDSNSSNDETLKDWVKNAKVKAGPEPHEYQANWDKSGKTTLKVHKPT